MAACTISWWSTSWPSVRTAAFTRRRSSPRYTWSTTRWRCNSYYSSSSSSRSRRRSCDCRTTSCDFEAAVQGGGHVTAGRRHVTSRQPFKAEVMWLQDDVMWRPSDVRRDFYWGRFVCASGAHKTVVLYNCIELCLLCAKRQQYITWNFVLQNLDILSCSCSINLPKCGWISWQPCQAALLSVVALLVNVITTYKRPGVKKCWSLWLKFSLSFMRKFRWPITLISVLWLWYRYHCQGHPKVSYVVQSVQSISIIADFEISVPTRMLMFLSLLFIEVLQGGAR